MSLVVFGTGVSTDPKRSGLFFRGGNVVNPRDGEQLNGPPWPTVVDRWFCDVAILPWLSIRWSEFALIAGIVGVLWGAFGASTTIMFWAVLAIMAGIVANLDDRTRRFGFYVGWKCYGFDLPQYLNWKGTDPRDVVDGSLALEPTIRFFTDGT